jgi:hypothetical protein
MKIIFFSLYIKGNVIFAKKPCFDFYEKVHTISY